MKTLKNADVKNKTVLMRVDFNVAMKEGEVAEDFRIRAVLPTIKYLFDNSTSKVILMSHLGRPSGKIDLQLSLRPVALRLSKLLGEEVLFIEDVIGGSAYDVIKQAKNRIILLENLRFYKGEEANNKIFAENLAKLADVFVEEAFGACHREHASIVGVTNFMPGYAGLLVEKEAQSLNRLLENPERPFCALIGGVKISTKIFVIDKFLVLADNVCLGGALANTALKAKGMAVGLSLVEEEVLTGVKQIDFTNARLHLPIDVKVAKDFFARDGFLIKGAGNIQVDEIILDIGPDTQDMFANIIKNAKTVLWNGPMGYLENRQFAQGTRRIAEEIANASTHAFTVVGGGETYGILQDMGLMDRIGFVSTGGGAMLKYLSEGTLPGIEALG